MTLADQILKRECPPKYSRRYRIYQDMKKMRKEIEELQKKLNWNAEIY